jgi:hypothetical protein
MLTLKSITRGGVAYAENWLSIKGIHGGGKKVLKEDIKEEG